MRRLSGKIIRRTERHDLRNLARQICVFLERVAG